jgi:L-rhamnose-H+ transport protein
MGTATTGFLLLLAAGIMNASFSFPMKRTRNWEWENTWLVWTIFALLVLPAVAVALSIPTPFAVYRIAGMAILGKVAIFGFGWGIAQVLFGLALDAIGIALAFSIVLGTSAATGSLLPLFQLHPEDVFRPSGLAILLGTFLVILGLFFCGIAGHRREKQKSLPDNPTIKPKMPFAQGLTLAALSGLLAAFMNFGVAYGGPLLQSAIARGSNASMAMNVIWWPLLAAGAIPNILYCLFLLNRKKSYQRFSDPTSKFYWFLALLMAALWLGSTLIYGIASHELGQLGPVIGWPLFMSVIVLSANGVGILSGEWKHAGKGALRTQAVGILFLILAVIALSRASS